MPVFSTNRGYIDEEKVRAIVTRLLESLGNEKSIWEYYNEMAAVEDNIREVEWRDLADTVLVFDGLFAATISAFLLFVIPQLQQNSTDVTKDVLIHISRQLSNSTTPAFEPAVFEVPLNITVVNMLFFVSLAIVLVNAFVAMLVKSWLQEFDRGWKKYTVAHLRAQEREKRLQKLVHMRVHLVVFVLPRMLQFSLLIFCVALSFLLFPLDTPTAQVCLFAFLMVVYFFGSIIYSSDLRNYILSSRAHWLLSDSGIPQTWQLPITRTIQRIASAIPFLNPPPRPVEDQQAGADTPIETTQQVPSSNSVTIPAQQPNLDGVEMGQVITRSRSDIDPQKHVHVLERLVTTTAEAVENVPIFIELLDQPVKDATLRPLNVERWRELLHITWRSLRDQSSIPVSAACTLARTMMICYNNKTVDQQLYHTLQFHLASREPDETRPRMPLHRLFPCYLAFWLGTRYEISRAIVFLEPSDAVDAELLWMVNTVHRARLSDGWFLGFFVAVLTYISSTEQSRRSQVPLTAAVVYALHTIKSALNQGSIDGIDGLCILPGTVSTSESALEMFCKVDGADALDLWSENCIQFVKDLLQWFQDDTFQLSLIAALYIDSTKQAHAHSTFADLLKYTCITDVQFRFSDAYDHGKLAVYWYMAVSQEPLDKDGYQLSGLYDVIANTMAKHSTLQLSGLHIMEIAVKHVHKTSPLSSGWLEKLTDGLKINAPGEQHEPRHVEVDHWVLLHLDTLLVPQPYLLPEEVKELQWPDTPAKVHIAKARLDLYDSFAKAGHAGATGPKPDPELLGVFLGSKDYEVCTRAFRWCLDLVSISQPCTPGDANGTRMFIPETLGHESVEHFVHVLCKGEYWERTRSWRFLISDLVPMWTMLPSSWCYCFASALLFSIVHPLDTRGLPAYQCLAEALAEEPVSSPEYVLYDKPERFLPFLATLLDLIKPSFTWAGLMSLESWLVQIPEKLNNQDTRTQMEHILATRKQQLVEETLGFFSELPMAGSWMDD